MIRLIEDVWISRWCLSSLIPSAVEVYPRETHGLLVGDLRYRKLPGERKKTRVLFLQSAYPVQTAKRKFKGVEWENIKARDRVLDAFDSIMANIAGEFHSHTKKAIPAPSKGDKRYVLRQWEEGRETLLDEWFELIIRINKRRYVEETLKGITGQYTYVKTERFILKTGKNRGYDITLAGWFYSYSMERSEPVSVRKAYVWIPWHQIKAFIP